ncbi:Pentatricopeptide repeat-containing protein, partial [Drosera capensis]
MEGSPAVHDNGDLAGEGDEQVSWDADEVEAISSLFQGRIPQRPGKVNRERPLPLPLPQLHLVPCCRIEKGSLSLTVRELGHMGFPERALQTFSWAQKQPHLFPDDRILASIVEILAKIHLTKFPSNLEKFVELSSRPVLEAMATGLILVGSLNVALGLVRSAEKANRILATRIYAKLIPEFTKNPDTRIFAISLLEQLPGRDDLGLNQQDCISLMKAWKRWALVWEMEASDYVFYLTAYGVVIKLLVALNDLSRTVKYFSKLKEASFSPSYGIYRDVVQIYFISGRLVKCKEVCKELESSGFMLDEQLRSQLLQLESNVYSVLDKESLAGLPFQKSQCFLNSDGRRGQNCSASSPIGSLGMTAIKSAAIKDLSRSKEGETMKELGTMGLYYVKFHLNCIVHNRSMRLLLTTNARLQAANGADARGGLKCCVPTNRMASHVPPPSSSLPPSISPPSHHPTGTVGLQANEMVNKDHYQHIAIYLPDYALGIGLFRYASWDGALLSSNFRLSCRLYWVGSTVELSRCLRESRKVDGKRCNGLST